MKTKQLTGRALDYAVALAEGFVVSDDGKRYVTLVDEFTGWDDFAVPQYCTGPQGDDIIDRELIGTDAGDGSFKGSKKWAAWMPGEMAFSAEDEITGTTRREAAMRAWVFHKLGEDVDIPKELM